MRFDISRQSLAKAVLDNPYDTEIRGQFSDFLLQDADPGHPVGSAERGRFILDLINAGYPTRRLYTAYFENLLALLKKIPRRSSPGRLVIGLGSGRCGSTTLSGIMTTIPGACATHENPPMVFWNPTIEQLQFHADRFRLLREHFALVFDAAHWWIRGLPQMRLAFPELRCIGLYRQTEDCVESFMRMKGGGAGSINHWAPQRAAFWRNDTWDPTYPTYPLVGEVKPDGAAKRALIRRYVEDYRARLDELAQQAPDAVRLVACETLDDPQTQRGIYDFVGLSGQILALRLNSNTTSHGALTLVF